MLEASKFCAMKVHFSSLHPPVFIQIAQKLPSAELKLNGMYDFASCLKKVKISPRRSEFKGL